MLGIYLKNPNPPKIVYPDSDGKRMADNTLQFEWIVTIKGNLDALFADKPNVFVAGDLLWYPVEGKPAICQAPDALVAFERPKGYRGSYKQWEEGGIPPQVVFEILSPNNTQAEMVRKFQFYERHGVEEYYLYDPDRNRLEGWRRQDGQLVEISQMNGWVSPRLGIRFELVGDQLRIYYPDGRQFLTFAEVVKQQQEAQRQAEAAQHQAEEAQRQVEEAQRQAEEAHRQAEEARQRAARLAAQLRALGIEPENGADSPPNAT